MFNDIQVPCASNQKLMYVSFEYIVNREGTMRAEVKVALVLEKGSHRNQEGKRSFLELKARNCFLKTQETCHPISLNFASLCK